MPKKEKSKKPGQPVQPQPTNIYDVLINLTNKIYDIVNSGNIIGIIAVIFLLIIWKLPPEYINAHLSTIISLFTAEKYYIIPMGSVLSFSVFINFYQRSTYREEIKRLTENRKTLVHGKENGTLKELPDHVSSQYDPLEDE